MRKIVMRRVGWLLGALIGMLLIIEVVARVVLGLGDPPLSMLDETIEYRFVPGTYHRFGNEISYNSFSMRADEITPTRSDPDELRVLVLGDSVINGGSLSDDRTLATWIAQQILRETLNRPVWVGNVSAYSWGPGNLLAYTERFGWFDADQVIIVLNGDDLIDLPSYPTALGPDLPTEKPFSATLELITRYLPRLWQFGGTEQLNNEPAFARAAQVREGTGLLRALLEQARAHAATLTVVYHPTRLELTDTSSTRAQQLQAYQLSIANSVAEQEGTLIDLGPLILDQLGVDQTYRDHIHLTADGQTLLAEVLIAIVRGQAASDLAE